MILRLERCRIDPEQAGVAADDEGLSVRAHRRGAAAELLGLDIPHPEDSARLAGVESCRTCRVRKPTVDVDVLNRSRRSVGCVKVGAVGVHRHGPVECVRIARVPGPRQIQANRDQRAIEVEGVDERAFVLAHVDAVEPVSVRRSDTREPKAGHGRASIALVEDDRWVELLDADVELADVVLGGRDVLDEEDALAIIANGIELEISLQVKLPHRLSKRRLDQQEMGCAGDRTRTWIEFLQDQPAAVLRQPAWDAAQRGRRQLVITWKSYVLQLGPGLRIDLDQTVARYRIEVCPVW